MSAIAPTGTAAPWDNVGLLLGDAADALAGPVLLTIDLTEAVANEAVSMKAGAIVAYHPPIFSGLKRLTASTPHGRTLLKLVRAGIGVFSPHTALDAAEGGVTDWLLTAAVGSDPGPRRAIEPAGQHAPGSAFKVVAFIPTDPPELIDRIREAMASVGAGEIGAYTRCSFAVPGVGSFHGEESSSPTVGEAGQLEFVTELRLEMVCSTGALAPALAALKREHPYEEPAFDVIKLEPRPTLAIGAGRVISLETPQRPSQIAAALKKSLGAGVSVHLAARNDNPISTVGAVPGSGGSLAPAAASLGCNVFITGEMKHHDVLASLDAGCAVILAGHTETERGYLPTLESKVRDLLPGATFAISTADRPPLKSV